LLHDDMTASENINSPAALSMFVKLVDVVII
jgi:hypothetical protein